MLLVRLSPVISGYLLAIYRLSISYLSAISGYLWLSITQRWFFDMRLSMAIYGYLLAIYRLSIGYLSAIYWLSIGYLLDFAAFFLHVHILDDYRIQSSLWWIADSGLAQTH